MTAKKKRDYTVIPMPEQHCRAIAMEFVVPHEDYEEMMGEVHSLSDCIRQYGSFEIMRDDLIKEPIEEAMTILAAKVKKA